MRVNFHNLPACDPYEYWCYYCGTMNISIVKLDHCPVCKYKIVLTGKLGELDLERLKKEHELQTFTGY